MPDDRLSAKEAALLAQVRAQLGKTTADAADAVASALVARAGRTTAAAAIETAAPGASEPIAPATSEPIAPATSEPVAPAASEPVAPAGATPETRLDLAQRVAALMAEARAETERRQRRLRQLCVWIPVAFISVVGLWTLLWMWHKL